MIVSIQLIDSEDDDEEMEIAKTGQVSALLVILVLPYSPSIEWNFRRPKKAVRYKRVKVIHS